MTTRRRPDGGLVRPALLVALGLVLAASAALLLFDTPPEIEPVHVVRPRAPAPGESPALPAAPEVTESAPERLVPEDATGPVSGVTLHLARAAEPGVPDPRFPVREEVFRGRLVDALGRPLADAPVYYVPGHATLHALGHDVWWAHQLEPGDLPMTRTDAEGRFELRGLHGPRCSEGLQMGDFWAVEPALVALAEGHAYHPHNCAGYRAGLYDAGTLRTEPEGRVRGRLVDADGMPLRDVDVVAVSDSVRPVQMPAGAVRVEDDVLEVFHRATSDAEGRFEVRGLWHGEVTLKFRGDAVASHDLDEVTVVGGDVTDLGSIVLQPGEAIAGRVIDRAGRPVAGAEVCVVSDNQLEVEAGADVAAATAAAFAHAFSLRGRADAGGRFAIQRARPRVSYNLYARAPGYEPALAWKVRVGDGPRELQLLPSEGFAVAVAEADGGRPRPDAVVTGWRLPMDNDLSGVPLAVARAGAPATHRLTGTGPGDHALLLDAKGLGLTLRRVSRDDLPAGGPLPLELAAGVAVNGRVVDSDGEPVPGARVAVELPVGLELPGLVALLPADVTDEAGRFDLGRLAPSSRWTWRLRTEATGFVRTPARKLSLDEGDASRPLELEIELMRAASVHGRLRLLSGVPAGGQDVTLWRRTGTHNNSWAQGVVSDPAGEYAFEGLEPGRYRVSWLRAMEFDLAEGEAKRVDLQQAPRPVVTGTVRRDGEPVSRGTVKLRRFEDEFGGRASQHSNASIKDGHYELELPAPGRYVMVAVASSPHGTSAAVELPIGWGERRLVDLDVGGVTVAGRVVSDATDRGLAGATVVAYDSERRLMLGSTRSRHDGGFAFHDVGAGTVRLQVRADAHEQWRGDPFAVPTDADVDLGDVVLTGRAQLRVTLPREPGASPPRISLTMVDLGQRTITSRMVTTGWGPFTLSMPKGGSYGVLVKRGHHPKPDPGDVWHPALVAVEVPAGQVTKLEVTPVDA